MCLIPSYQQCGCVNPYQWSTRSVVLPGTSKVIQALLCNISDPCVANAIIRLSNETSLWDKFCGSCTQACSTTEFLVTTSSVAAPGYPFDFVAKAFVEATQVPLPVNWLTSWATHVTNNYVGLDIVCQSKLIENFTQDPSMSAVDVLSNVGGQTGLWIGVSIVSIMELLEMLYRLVRYECHVIARKIRPAMKVENRWWLSSPATMNASHLSYIFFTRFINMSLIEINTPLIKLIIQSIIWTELNIY